ncbi:hypothetical protein UlMin_039872 [Ulmus minor]
MTRYTSQNERLIKNQEYRSHQRIHSVSISMPSTPTEDHLSSKKRVIFDDLPISNGTKKTGPEDVFLQNTDVEALPVDRYYDVLEGPELETLRYYHPIHANFFFAPWIALLFLALGAPPSIAENLHKSLWYILMTPILCLELKIYGQWMSGGQIRLSKVSNPSNHLSIFGNFVGALLGASMGLIEGPTFFFFVGLAHCMVLFTLPKELHPVFFLFVVAPSVAYMAWAKLQRSFDYRSRISYFIALFLYFSLFFRINKICPSIVEISLLNKSTYIYDFIFKYQ